MKIYTRTGDRGETGLIGGRRISKSDPRIVAYGAVDELNSCIGLAVARLSREKDFGDICGILVHVQNELFVLGSDLADPSYPQAGSTPRVEEGMAAALEPAIDRLESELSPISFFILPGGSIEASMLHQCRAVARRAETAVVALANSEKINPAAVIYLNRLSDMLFVAARAANKRSGVPDIAWKSGKKD